MKYLEATYPLILLKKTPDYVLNISTNEKLKVASNGKNTYYGDIQIKSLYETTTSNGSYVSYEFKPFPVNIFIQNPITKSYVTDNIMYYTYNSISDFTNYYNDTYTISYNINLPSETYTVTTQSNNVSGTNSLTTNNTYTYTFSKDICVMIGKEMYIYQNNLKINSNLFILGNAELRIIDNLI